MVQQLQGDGKSQVAQFMYLAQLEACQYGCKCKGCQLMRKATSAMSDAVLAGKDMFGTPAADEANVEPAPTHPAES